MTTVIVDTSVVLKWLLDDEAYVQQALKLRDDFLIQRRFKLCAPDLWVYEMVNGLTVAVRQGRIKEDDASGCIKDILSLGVEDKKPDPIRIYAMAQEYSLSAYDAAYLALAESAQCNLWTGDRSFYQSAKSHFSRIKWIGDY